MIGITFLVRRLLALGTTVNGRQRLFTAVIPCAFAAAVLANQACSAQTLSMLQGIRIARTMAYAKVNSAASKKETEFLRKFHFGVFADDAFSGAVSTNGPIGGLDLAQATSTAEQWSLIQKGSVEAFGETNLFAQVNNGPSVGSAMGAGLTSLNYKFSLSGSTGYQVLANLSRFGPVSDAAIELRTSLGSLVFGIGEPFGYSQTSLNQSGTLAAGDYVMTLYCDTEHKYLGPTFPTTAGSEFSMLFTVDVFAPGEIVNGGFHNPGGTNFGSIADPFGWTVVGPGSAQLDEDADNSFLLMETGSPVSVEQAIDTGHRPFTLSFDYEFLNIDGALEVWLGSELLATIDAPTDLVGAFSQAALYVDSSSLLNQTDVPLLFRFDGPQAGLQLRLDNVNIAAIPEPTAGLLMLLATSFVTARCRAKRVSGR